MPNGPTFNRFPEEHGSTVPDAGGHALFPPITAFSSDANQPAVKAAGTQGALAASFSGDVQFTGNLLVTGDILLQGADCAEQFDVAEIPPAGAVMVAHEDGTLHLCRRDYDPRVVGVVSGAGMFVPGIVLDKRDSDSPRATIGLVGKVYCMVDSRENRVMVGDLLTTSGTPGHARVASDHERSRGTIIGKALASISGCTGMIPMLIGLQ
jgi:hypothetical protein